MLFNRSSEFIPLSATNPWLQQSPRPSLSTPQDGLYFRSLIHQGSAEEITRFLNGEVQDDDLSLDAYQSWNEQGWKEPHVSKSAMSRFGQKAIEEAREVESAAEDYFDSKENGDLVLELGDFTWVATAVANNTGIIVSDELKHALYQYSMGIKVYDGRVFREPDWYDAATKLAIKKGSLTLGDIDQLNRDAKFVPLLAPVMNIDPDDDMEASITGACYYLQWYSVIFKSFVEDYEQYLNFSAPQTSQLEDLAKVIVGSYLQVAWIANEVGSSLSEVVTQNIKKIEKRVQSRTVDKTDFGR